MKSSKQKPSDGGKIPPSPETKKKVQYSLKRRILQRVSLALIFAFLVIFAQEMGWLDRFSDEIQRQKLNWLDNTKVVEYLRHKVIYENLTKTRPECLLFIINGDDPPEAVDIKVMEKHNTQCPETDPSFPLLFTLRVNRLNHTVQTDKGSPNHFYPLF